MTQDKDDWDDPATSCDESRSHSYVVVLRAGSRLRILPGDQLQVNANIGKHKCVLTFRTRYSNEGFSSQVPRELWIDARGSADNLDEAIVSFSNAALFFTTVLSFCMNGEAGDCKFNLAYDSTPGLEEREFFEQFIEDERGLPFFSRRIKPELVAGFLGALATSPHLERLRRAIVQYGLALKYWSKGEEILSVAHLYMGIESLVPLMGRVVQERLDLTSRDELADNLGVSIQELDATIRKTYLFCGDNESHRAAKRASDGIEHGFLEMDEIRPLAISVRDKTAGYLRKAIIELVNLPQGVAEELLAKPYDIPLGTEGYIRYLRGAILSNNDDVAAAGSEYPFIEWRFGVKDFSVDKDGSMHFSFSNSMTPRIAEGASFHPKRVEVYGPEGVVATPKQLHEVEPEIVVRRQPSDPSGKSQAELSALLREALAQDNVLQVHIKTKDNETFVISREPINNEK